MFSGGFMQLFVIVQISNNNKCKKLWSRVNGK